MVLYDEQFRLKVGLAEMLKGGVIMDVVNAEQAVIAEKAGASAVMALERVPSDIRKEGGVARMSPVSKIREIMAAVSIPVMAKARIGHFTEARVLEALELDYIDESEVLTPADEEHHINKRDFRVPFVCGARNLGEALRRIAEGATMIRTKGEAGSGNIVEAVRHMRTIIKEMRQLTVLGKEELVHEAKKLQAPLELVEWVAEHGKLPVPNFSAGGIATPADAALVMHLGAEARALQREGVTPIYVRNREDLDGLDGLIIPGGESTTMLKLMGYEDLLQPIREFGRTTPMFGTCAGAILMASQVSNPPQESL